MDPLLSVCLITYNHKQYIQQAIEGVLMQKVSFPIKLIIADDFSTDGTRDILHDYKEKYPNLIHLILQEKNVGPAQNWKVLISAPKSKYIAYFEGDDYWIDEFKLQKQVDLLESRPDCSISFHKVITIDNDNNILNDVFDLNDSFPDELTIQDLAARNFIPTSSAVFRNLPLIKSNLQWLSEQPVGDWPLMILLADTGKIHFSHECMSVYRKHDFGIWSSSSYYKKAMDIKKLRQSLNKIFSRKYGDIFYSNDQKVKDAIYEMEYYKKERRVFYFFKNYIWLLAHKKYTKFSYGSFILFLKQFIWRKGD